MGRLSRPVSSFCGAVAAWLLVVAPIAEAQQQNCVVTGGTNYGSITQNCIIAPSRLTFQADIADEIIRRLAPGKTIRLLAVGGNADQAVATQYQAYLQRHGFQIERAVIGMMSPPPDAPITINRDGTTLLIAPSAR